MSQTTRSQGWFIQLQKQYPTSALVTELVQIHQERFIVKAIVQMGSVAIATSMAESAHLETAEDQARLRVLDFLGISVISGIPNLDAIPVPQPVVAPIRGDRFPEMSLPEISLPEISLPEMSLPEISLPEISLPEMSLPEISLPEISLPEISSPSISQATDNGFPIPSLPSLDLEPVGVSAPLPIPELPMPAMSVELPIPFSTALFSPEEISTEEATLTEEDSAEVGNDFEEEYLPHVEDYGKGYEDSEPEDLPPASGFVEDSFPQDLVMATEIIAPIAPVEGVQDDQLPTPAHSSQLKKAIAEETPVASTPADANEPDDLSTLIAHTDIEMDRIGWTKQEGRDYLKRTYKKSTRQRLDLDELMDFLNYLRALPSVNGL